MTEIKLNVRKITVLVSRTAHDTIVINADSVSPCPKSYPNAEKDGLYLEIKASSLTGVQYVKDNFEYEEENLKIINLA